MLGKRILRILELVLVIAWFVVIFGINTASDISNFTSRWESEIWDNWQFEISWMVLMPSIPNKSRYYLIILQPEKFSHVMPSVYFRQVVSFRWKANCFQSSCVRPCWSKHWARSMYFSLYFGFLLVHESPEFQSLQIFPSFFRNSQDEIISWFWLPQ